MEITASTVTAIVAALGGSGGLIVGVKAFFGWLAKKDADALEIARLTTTKVEALFEKLGTLLEKQHESNDGVADHLSELATELRELRADVNRLRDAIIREGPK